MTLQSHPLTSPPLIVAPPPPPLRLPEGESRFALEVPEQLQLVQRRNQSVLRRRSVNPAAQDRSQSKADPGVLGWLLSGPWAPAATSELHSNQVWGSPHATAESGSHSGLCGSCLIVTSPPTYLGSRFLSAVLLSAKAREGCQGLAKREISKGTPMGGNPCLLV